MVHEPAKDHGKDEDKMVRKVTSSVITFTHRNARKERRKKLRDSYNTRERREAAYLAYLEEIKEINGDGAEKQVQKNVVKVKDSKDEGNTEKKGDVTKTVGKGDDSLEKQQVDTTFVNPSVEEIKQLLCEEPKPVEDKKID